jgi:hypothetical protein
MSPTAGGSPAISACGGGLAQPCELVLGGGDEHVAIELRSEFQGDARLSPERSVTPP